MSPKDFSVNILGRILSTDGMSKEGIRFDLLNKNTQNMLSIFNTDADKTHLSKQELTDAILYFKKFGPEYEYPDADITELFESSKMQKWSNNPLALSEIIRPMLENKNFDKQTIHKLIDTYIANPRTRHLAHSYCDKDPESAAKMLLYDNEDILNEAVDSNLSDISDLENKTKIADKQGLKLSKSNRNIARGKDGVYYKYNTKNNTFQKSNIKSVMKDGSYTTDKANKKAQHTEIKYSKDDRMHSITAKNYQNKKYTNEKYAAKVAGLTYNKENNTYNKGTELLKWNPEKYQFETI